jgi:sugar phosphate isomerase/epimerase
MRPPRKRKDRRLKLSVAVKTDEIDIEIPVALLSGTFEQCVHKAADLGYEGVELLVSAPRVLDGKKIHAVLEDRGLSVSAIGSGAVKMFEKLTLLAENTETERLAAGRLYELIDFAAILGAPFVTIGGFRGRSTRVTPPVAREKLKEIIEKALEKASAVGVRLVLEPLNRYESEMINNTKQGIEFIEETGNSCLGLVLDTFHMNIEEPSLPAAFEYAASSGRLWHIHIGDSNRLPPGKGHIDFDTVVRTLHTLGYEGYLSAELLPLPDKDTAAEETIRRMRELIHKIDNEGNFR